MRHSLTSPGRDTSRDATLCIGNPIEVITVRPNRRNRVRQTMRVKGANDRNQRRVDNARDEADRLASDRLSMPAVLKRYGPVLEQLPADVRADWLERLISAPHEKGPLNKWSWSVSRVMRSHWKRAAKLAEYKAS
jgi:hypothetical protein